MTWYLITNLAVLVAVEVRLVAESGEGDPSARLLLVQGVEVVEQVLQAHALHVGKMTMSELEGGRSTS